MTSHANTVSRFDRELVLKAAADAFRKLSPRLQFRNPVMFVVFVCSVLTTLLWAQAIAHHGEAPAGFIFWISVWLWFTLLFANFAEALAEGRGKAQAATLRAMRQHVQAKRIDSRGGRQFQIVEASALKREDLVLVEANDVIPADGEVVEGVA